MQITKEDLRDRIRIMTSTISDIVNELCFEATPPSGAVLTKGKQKIRHAIAEAFVGIL